MSADLATVRARTNPLTLLWKNKQLAIGAALVAVLVLLAVLAPVVTPHDPIEQSIRQRYRPPSSEHWFGTDTYGRDVFSRAVYGARYSLGIAASSIALALAIGSTLGMAAGFFGGTLDRAMTALVNILMAFPSILLGIVLMAALGTGIDKLVITLTITFIPRFIRLARGPTMMLKKQEYVLAAQAVGMSQGRILFRHILPNIAGDLLVMGALWLATAILAEAGLSFLGLGVQPPAPSWGGMIRDGVDVINRAPWISVYAGLMISLAVLAFNMVGDSLRDLMDPRMQG